MRKWCSLTSTDAPLVRRLSFFRLFGLFPSPPLLFLLLLLLRSTLCRSPSFYPPDKRRQPPTDSSANSVSELQDFSSLRSLLPPSLFLVSRPCLALHGPRLSLENPGLVSCRRITRSYLRLSLSLSSPSIHPSTIFLFPFSRSLYLFLFSPFRNEKLRRYKHRRRRRRRRSKRR